MSDEAEEDQGGGGERREDQDDLRSIGRKKRSWLEILWKIGKRARGCPLHSY